MDLFEAIRDRKSVRRFKPDAVPDGDMRAIIEAATLAPSASNAQMWRFVVVSNKDLLARMRDAILAKYDEYESWPEAGPYRNRLQAGRGWSTFFADAPATIVVLGDRYRSAIEGLLEERGWSRESVDALRQRPDIQSIGAAIQNLCLAAHAMGYGTCWMSAPCIAGAEMKEILGIQPPWEIIALVPIGIPDDDPPARPRKTVDEVVEFIR